MNQSTPGTSQRKPPAGSQQARSTGARASSSTPRRRAAAAVLPPAGPNRRVLEGLYGRLAVELDDLARNTDLFAHLSDDELTQTVRFLQATVNRAQELVGVPTRLRAAPRS